MPVFTEPSVRVRAAAQRLAEAEINRAPCAPIRDLIDTADIDSAYAVQQHNVAAARASGRYVVGRKIGLTSPAVQRQLGVDQPDFGVLYDDMDVSNSVQIPINRLLQPKIEAEVAFVLGRSITDPVEADAARDHVAEVIAAFEIVDSRVADWDISLADTIADNASSGLYVLGDRLNVNSAPDLAAVTMTVTDEQGTTLSAGTGADCLGSPYKALAWLANTALRFGNPLQEGDVILSGALGPMVPVTAGATYTATISDIGTVTAAFSAN
ncbi:2-keto-4-pentenoate hydratase (plasmid) [Gordonia sp. JH63]|uniref:2-keto-4-pentenoate hydratase n=1 Tax=Gordonia sp. JH63 TaxID=2698900 RepID=UPI00131FF3A7|nr:fumarylacetoacetate hydrolase family protein [Gordonia sp. JH63]QHD88391.1 2-keto-4-pentenoate hydratase [Gordonia sp. JH63]